MDQDRKFTQFGNSKGSFGAGFVLGAVFTVLAGYFLFTKSGRELAKKITSADFDFDKFTALTKELENWSENSTIQDLPDQLEKTQTPRPTQPARSNILGKRFFRRH